MRSEPSGFDRTSAKRAPSPAGGGAPPSPGGGSAADLVRARDLLLAPVDGGARPARPRLNARNLRAALVDLHEFWLTVRATDLGMGSDSGMALVAVGGLARCELMPYSDIDLVLLHDGHRGKRLSEVADGLWYPLWDANVSLDHSVRTVAQARDVAAGDLTAALGLLDARCIAGDEALAAQLITTIRTQWRSGIRDRFDAVADQARQRWYTSGDIAHRIEPDLKHGRGGLRDLQLLDALAAAQLTQRMPGFTPGAPAGDIAEAKASLLDVRTELHRVARRPRDLLQAQDADEIAAALRLGDRFDLARVLSGAARTVSFAVETGLRTARAALPRRGLAALRRPPVRRPLDDGVVEHGGEVVLARDAHPAKDHALVLRVAAASARTGLPMSAATLAGLGEAAPELRAPWPREAVDELLAVLGEGHRAVDTIEALDRSGLWGRLLPEWGSVRDLPPRDASHTWTVDRHLTETAAHAAALTTRVSRPDLLLLGALVHDIGKGRGGDHSIVGAELATQIGTRLGLWPSDVVLLSAVVRHHLLLPVTATRRDLADPVTVAAVVDALDGDAVLLELLHALAEADSRATGPGVWGGWKASLIGELVTRCRLVMAGEPPPVPAEVTAGDRALAEAGGLHVRVEDAGNGATTVVVIAPDTPGLLAHTAGVLALHSLQVHSASVSAHEGAVVDSFVVSPRFGEPPAAALLRQDVRRALEEELDVKAALAAKERDYGISTRPDHPADGPRLIWVDDASSSSVLLELRALDRAGLLHSVARALEGCGAEIRWAKVVTLGTSVVDVFALRPEQVDSTDCRRRIDTAVTAAAAVPDASGTA